MLLNEGSAWAGISNWCPQRNLWTQIPRLALFRNGEVPTGITDWR
jgi:hypothetical protein